MKKAVIPSIIAKNQIELTERLRKVESPIYQLDIMDGKFVRNKSLMFDFEVLPKIRYEAHLMVSNPSEWVRKNHEKVDTIIFHLESVKNPERLIKLIKEKKKKVGIAINPKTPTKNLIPFLNQLDMVLIMTVIPGRYGARFLPKMLNKVKEIRALNENLNIEVDGGVNNKTIHHSSRAGATSFVVGSYLQNSESPKKALAELRSKIK